MTSSIWPQMEQGKCLNKLHGGFKKGHIGYKSMLGKYMSKESRKKMSEKHKGIITWNKGKHLSEETKRKISKARKGQKLSEETKRKLSEISKRIGTGKWMKGKGIKEKNNNWQGGISFEPYSTDWTETLKKSIRERDHYICRVCLGYGYIVHHINYDKKNCNPDNLIVLCNSCHSKTNNSDRIYWINYFQNLKIGKN